MELYYGKCEKCNCMGGLNDNMLCLRCIDEKKLLSKLIKIENVLLKQEIENLHRVIMSKNKLIDEWYQKSLKDMNNYI